MVFDKESARAAGKLKKGKKHLSTRIKAEICSITEDSMISQIERNMNEFLNSPDPKVRMEATKYFSEFWKPKKSVQDNRYSGQITFNVNPQLAGKQPETLEPAEFKVLDSANIDCNSTKDKFAHGQDTNKVAENDRLLQNNAELQKDAENTGKIERAGGTPSARNGNGGEVDF